MDLQGIENENGYFPEGFLADGLEAEIADAQTRWSQGDDSDRSPMDRLDDVGAKWLSAVTTYRARTELDAKRTARAELGRLIVESLGFEYKRQGLDLEDGQLAPSLALVPGPDGRDLVWVLEAPEATSDPNADPLSLAFQSSQLLGEEAEAVETDRPLEDLLADQIFSKDHPPRFVLVVGTTQLVLVRRTKWHERAVLRFNLAEIFDRDEPDTLGALACFVSREAIAPLTGAPLAERLEEEAQRKANAVTSSLKETVRDAIEILGQEVLDVTRGKYPDGHHKAGTWIRGEDLTPECLRYMYRLLFLFYAEANPRLGVLDMKNPVYTSGYSLEALRAYENIHLSSTLEREGTFLWESLQKLLSLFNDGTGNTQHKLHFDLKAARVHLLDPRSTPILSAVNLRNEAIQKIIRKLSLKKSRSGTGRISYARLGIGQLGAVYETLISFTGFVAKEDLIEIRPAKQSKGAGDEDAEDAASDEASSVDGDWDFDEVDSDDIPVKGRGPKRKDEDLLKPSWFVPRTRAKEFPVDQVIYEGNDPRIYTKGQFIYRLAGRDREKTAAYYTPEPLARLLVKHTLMERCRDMPADDILKLTILEPAMGSAAFLVETVNQLSDLYLERKQAEVGTTIPQADYFTERQKVRAYISDRNCFGVDLNPIATELGAISLWLNSLHAGKFSPYFGDQLHAGNSLIGARRASFFADSLKAKGKDSWMKILPKELGWREQRPEDHVWQFLLPAPGMCKFDTEKSIKAFAGETQNQIKAWRKGGWEKPFSTDELALVKRLSKVVDQLFDAVADDLKRSRELCNDAITLWPDKDMGGVENEDFVAKRHRLQVMRGERRLDDTVPYRRLKTAMDAWCALWMWPLDKAHLLPDRRTYLMDLRMLLEGGFMDSETFPTTPAQGSLLDMFAVGEAEQLASELPSVQTTMQFNPTDVSAFVAETEWLTVATQVAERERFTHYDLVFADILHRRGGFDVIVGNPPWARPGWNEGLVLSDLDPIHAGLSATEAKAVLSKALAAAPQRTVDGQKQSAEIAFLREFTSTRGAMAVTSSEVMNPYAGGGSNNLYRCFVDLSFRLMSANGNTGMIHQDGHLGDPKSGNFRRHWYGRIAKHFEFSNKIKSKVFAEVHDEVKFSLNVYKGSSGQIEFVKLTNAFLPSQVEESFSHDGSGVTPAIKGSEGDWDTRGHVNRIIHIDRSALSVIHSLSEEEDVPVEEARFIQPFSKQMLEVFKQLAEAPKLGTVLAPDSDGFPKWQMSACWHESGSQKDGTIERVTDFRDAANSILQGPLFHVGNPFNKTPRARSRTNADYDAIDLSAIPDDYLPRTNYGPAVDFETYRSRMTGCRWDPSKKHTDFYRVAFRAMINLNSERSLIGALIPNKASHVNSVQSVAWNSNSQLLNGAALFSSLTTDFMIKASGKQNLHDRDVQGLPWIETGATARHRALRLASLTTAYANLWDSEAPTITAAPWSNDDQRLALEGPVEGPTTWDRSAGLRTDFARRLALVEIDVLVAQALGLTLDQLIEIYRIYFPVLQENEAGTWYDQQGRIVWTCSKGLPGVGYLERSKKGDWKSPGRSAWEKILLGNPERLSCEAIDDTQPGGPRTVTREFVGPFTKSDRVEDYRRAWTHFEKLRAEGVEV